jgi:tRNA (cmo5U34)-methyltransferase
MSQPHFDPATYAEFIRREIPRYESLQESVAAATASLAVTSILDLGTGTGETLWHVLGLHPAAHAIGLDESDGMLAVARARLHAYDITLQRADLLDALPWGPFDVVVSALAVHHLDAAGKATLFERVAGALRPGGRFVLGDVILPEAPVSAAIDLTDGWDKPSSVADQVRWLEDVGLVATVVWAEDDLALFVAARPMG